MKRILSLALVLCMVLMCGIFTGCSKEVVEGANVINDAIKNTQALESLEAELSMVMDTEVEGETMSVPITVGIKDDGNVMFTKIGMEMLGQTVDMDIYTEGEWAYISAMGTSYKLSLADETAAQYDYTRHVEAMIQEIPEELLGDIELKTNDDGSQTVALDFEDDEFTKLFDKFIKASNSLDEDAELDITISDATVAVTVKDGYVSAYEMTFKMDMDLDGVVSSTNMTASVTYKNPGEKVTVEPMEGYKDFADYASLVG